MISLNELFCTQGNTFFSLQIEWNVVMLTTLDSFGLNFKELLLDIVCTLYILCDIVQVYTILV